MNTPLHLRGVHHIAIQTHNLARMESFYCGVLGLPCIARHKTADGFQERSIWVSLSSAGSGAGESFLAIERVPSDLLQKSATDPTSEPEVRQAVEMQNAAGYLLLALGIERSARMPFIERLTTAGFAIYHQTAYTIYVRDPDGNRLALSHYPEPHEGV